MLAKDIIEMALPPEGFGSAPLYHGTRGPAGDKILREGIRPGAITQGRSNLAPVKGRVYITPSIRYAVIYALGGVLMGHKIEKAGYGYVFEIDPENVSDVQPDEDDAGAVLYYYKRYKTGDRAASPYADNPDFINALYADPEFMAKVALFAINNMTDRQARGAMEGDIGAQAAGGKRMLKVMPAWMAQKLVQLGAHVGAEASSGTIWPLRAWKLDYSDSVKLKPDASNFFDVAQQVSI